ncbi:hypothetical protein PVAG01_00469 [Phlyctema vagabunda]|uniref:Uncharacterized protein n=1 Tax=Phlyctema vagabunda TaxID=108571 RepID=A0ABR4PUC6_9HELO
MPVSLENIAARQSGELILTSIISPRVYQFDPSSPHDPLLVAEVPGIGGMTGIAELEKDVFYVVGLGVETVSPFAPVPGSMGVWRIDVRDCAVEAGAVTGFGNVTLVAMLPDSQLLNGLCRLASNDTSNLLIADSLAGTVTRLDVTTGKYEVVIADPTMTITAADGLQVAINGIEAYDADLFFTNYNQGLFARVPISLATGHASGIVDIVVRTSDVDDFAISRDGKKAYIAQNGQSTLSEVDIPNRSVKIVVNSTDLGADASVAIGRTGHDWDTLYVTASGTTNETVAGNSTVSGRIVSVDIPAVKFFA